MITRLIWSIWTSLSVDTRKTVEFNHSLTQWNWYLWLIGSKYMMSFFAFCDINWCLSISPIDLCSNCFPDISLLMVCQMFCQIGKNISGNYCMLYSGVRQNDWETRPPPGNSGLPLGFLPGVAETLPGVAQGAQPRMGEATSGGGLGVLAPPENFWKNGAIWCNLAHSEWCLMNQWGVQNML